MDNLDLTKDTICISKNEIEIDLNNIDNINIVDNKTNILYLYSEDHLYLYNFFVLMKFLYFFQKLVLI